MKKTKEHGVMLLFRGGGGESKKQWETKRCKHGARLGYKNPRGSRALGTAGLPQHLPL